MAVTKPNVNRLWAGTGTVVEPDAAKQDLGWVAEVPTFQNTNWLENKQDTFNLHVNQWGIPEWDALTAYPQHAWARSTVNGQVYVSTLASDNIGNEPSVSPSNQWAVLATSGDVPSSRAINTAANSGLSGGGNLSADRNLAVDVNNLIVSPTPTTLDQLILSDTSNSNTPGRLSLSALTTFLAGQSGLGEIIGDGDQYRIVSGVMRQLVEDGGWAFLTTASHVPVGINEASISQTATSITFNYDFTATDVVALVVVPDETMARRGVIAGASVGLTSATIELAMPLVAWVEFDDVGGNTVFGDPAVIADISAVESTPGIVTITHGTISAGGTPPILGQIRGGWGGSSIATNHASPGIMEIGGIPNATSFEVQCSEVLRGRAFYNGTSWEVTSDQESGTFAFSASWSVDTLTITHPRVQSNFGTTLTPVEPALYPQLNSANPTTTLVNFFDRATGNLVTTESTQMNVEFTRPGGLIRYASFPNSEIGFSRGVVRVNPNKLFDAVGNLWILGIMKTN